MDAYFGMDRQHEIFQYHHRLPIASSFRLATLLQLIFSIAFILCCATAFLINKRRRRRRSLRLPPGPSPLPLLGNLRNSQMYACHIHDFQECFTQLSKKYGPIVRLQWGSVPAVLVSSASLAMDILKTQDLKFATRPSTAWGRCMSYECADIVFCPYNPRWLYLRKVLKLELLTAERMEQHKDLRMQEVRHMLQCVHRAAEGEEVVDVESKLSTLGFDIVSRLLFNERCTGSTRKDLAELRTLELKLSELIDTFVVEDHFPWLGLFIHPHKRQMKSTRKRIDELLEQILVEHEEAAAANPAHSPTLNSPDFVDTLLRLQKAGTPESKYLGRDTIKAIVVDILVGASESPTLIASFAMSYLLRNPEFLKHAQAEVDDVVGHGRMVDESHIPQLHFVKAIIRETFRLQSETLFRECVDDCEVGGYDIPRGTRVFLNTWDMCHDPSFWERPFDFYPQRFLEESRHIEEQGQSFHLIPFGSGRRRCPAISLGLTITHLILASLLHCFDWHLPQKNILNLEDGTMVPFPLIPKPRSSTRLYMEA